MRAALLTAIHQPVAIETVPDPACPRDGAIVGIRACGICRSDLHTWNGAEPDIELPHIMGHELAGEVLEVGPECRTFRRGDRVTAPFILGCGHCQDCTSGHPTICEDQHVIGFNRPGAFAELVAIRNADFNLVRLPDAISYVEAAGMGCRVTTAWRGLADRGGLQPGEWLAVHGCGGVGLSAIMLAKTIGARTIAIDVNAAALAKAEALGAELLVDAFKTSDVGAAVRELTGGGAHLSIDALGITATFDNSLRSLRKLGRHVQIGFPIGRDMNVDLALAELVYSRQLSLHGMRGLGAAGFASLLDMATTGKLDLSRLVTERVSLEGLQPVLESMQAGTSTGIAVIDRF